MTTTFSVLGCNYVTSPLEVREHIAFHKDSIKEGLSSLNKISEVESGLILSTCNRTEIYYIGNIQRKSLVEWLAKFHHITPATINSFMYKYEDKEALHHLLRVASGLDSMALGENQVLGQLKDAYKIAKENSYVSSKLDRIMQFVFATSKKTRSLTDIGKHTTTLASTSVSIADKVLGGLSSANALIVGAGDNARLTAEYLSSRGIGKLCIANRTYSKAEELAKKHNGEAIALMDIYSYLPMINAIFTSTSSPTILVGKGMVEVAVKKQGKKPLFISDMSIPHDVEYSVAELEQVYIYTLKDLEIELKKNHSLKEKQIGKAELLIEKEINTHISILLYSGISSGAILKDYRAQVYQWKQAELEPVLKEVKDIKTRKIIQKMADRLSAKLSHGPTNLIRDGWQKGDLKTLSYVRSKLIQELNK